MKWGMIHLKFYSLLPQISRRVRRMYTALAVERSTSADVAIRGGLSRERFTSDRRLFSSTSQTWRTESTFENSFVDLNLIITRTRACARIAGQKTRYQSVHTVIRVLTQQFQRVPLPIIDPRGDITSTFVTRLEIMRVHETQNQQNEYCSRCNATALIRPAWSRFKEINFLRLIRLLIVCTPLVKKLLLSWNKGL